MKINNLVYYNYYLEILQLFNNTNLFNNKLYIIFIFILKNLILKDIKNKR